MKTKSNLLTDMDYNQNVEKMKRGNTFGGYVSQGAQFAPFAQGAPPFAFAPYVPPPSLFSTVTPFSRSIQIGPGQTHAPAHAPAPAPAPGIASGNCSSFNITDDDIDNYGYECNNLDYQRYLPELDPTKNTDCLSDSQNKMSNLISKKNNCDWEEKVQNASCHATGKCFPTIPNISQQMLGLGQCILFQKKINTSRIKRIKSQYVWNDNNCSLQVLHDLDILGIGTAEAFHSSQGRNITDISGRPAPRVELGGTLNYDQITYLLNAKHSISHPYDTLVPKFVHSVFDLIRFITANLLVDHMTPLYLKFFDNTTGAIEGHAVFAYRDLYGIYISDRSAQGGVGCNGQNMSSYLNNNLLISYIELGFYCIIEDRTIDNSNRYDSSPKRKLSNKLKSPKRKVANKIKSPKRKVANKLKSPKRKVANKLKSPKRKLVNKLKSPKRKVANKLKSPKRKVANKLKSPKRKVANKK
jgi:hypothetical protein